MDRKYSVQEIDALRDVVEQKWLWGRYSGPESPPRDISPANPFIDRFGNSYGSLVEVPYSPRSRSYTEPEKSKCVEEMVRTHMLAGHTADDLVASEVRSAA